MSEVNSELLDAPEHDRQPASCPTCATVSTSKFCPNCGEQLNRNMERSLFRFLAEALGTVFQPADSKLGRSLWRLLRYPGMLTLAYIKGKHIPYTHPFRLFLIANLFFFLFASFTGNSPLTTKLSVHTSATNFLHTEIAHRMVETYVETNQLDYATFEASFNRRVEVLSKSLVFLMIPAFACLLGLILIKRKEFAVKHLVFSCHTYTHLLFYNFTIGLSILAIAARPFRLLLSQNEWEFILSGTSLLIVCTFFFLGLKRAYNLKTWSSALITTILGYGIYLILLIYRAILFFATYYSLSLA